MLCCCLKALKADSHSPFTKFDVFAACTFSGSSGPQMINSSQDEPEGLLLFTRDAQHLHGCLQLGELLWGSLLVFRLDEIRSDQTSVFIVGHIDHTMKMWNESLQTDTCRLNIFNVVTLDWGRIPKALFSARWFKCSSVLEERRREASCWGQEVPGCQSNADASGCC